MSKYFLFLQTVHDTVHDLGYNTIKKSMTKSDFSSPKIFTGGEILMIVKNFLLKIKTSTL